MKMKTKERRIHEKERNQSTIAANKIITHKENHKTEKKRYKNTKRNPRETYEDKSIKQKKKYTTNKIFEKYIKYKQHTHEKQNKPAPEATSRPVLCCQSKTK